VTPNNNLNVLPFYTNIEEQNHRKEYAFGNVYTLISPTSKLLPFQIVREKQSTPSAVGVFQLINFKTGAATNILSEMVAAGFALKLFADFDLLINYSALAFGSAFTMAPGQYYVRITDAENEWFSDVFTVVEDLSKYLKLEYWDSQNLEYSGGLIDYAHPYKNYCYLQTAIGKPEYPFEEEVENRDGFTFVEKQVSEKKYKFTFLAPEYLCDALRIVRMHDFANIYTLGRKYSVENIIFTPDWQTQGDIASVSVEFECDTVIKKIGAANAIPNGDFANDFDDDFTI
jgi:hypothetical protein